MPFIRSLINLLLYGNFWIALCSTALLWQTELLRTGSVDYLSVPSRFVFCATLFLYAIHRIIGISKVRAFQHKGRFKVIHKYRNHIKLYAVVGTIGAGWYFFQLSRPSQWMLIPAGLISLAYVLPIQGGKRLRDVHYIKLFLIALVFACITVGLPYLETGSKLDQSFWWMLMERFLFILAITLPFDIRDLVVDAHTSVLTLPRLLGVQRAVHLSLALLGLVMLLALWQHRAENYTDGATIGLLFALGITGCLLWWSSRAKHDYYFSGLLDGTMLLTFLGCLAGVHLL